MNSRFFSRLEIDEQDWCSYLIESEIVSERTQRQFVGKSGKAAFQEAVNTIELLLQATEKLGGSIRDDAHLLDFGCGWGRIAKAASRYFEPENIMCVDVQDDAIALVQQSAFPFIAEKIPTRPPTKLDDDSFDIVVAFSVFSHLNEESANAWIREFSRILKPGGVFFITTRPRSFILWTEHLRKDSDIPEHALNAATSFRDSPGAIEQYDAGEFVFDAEHQSGPLAASGYGQACIPEAYVRKHWAELFSNLMLESAAEAGISQSIIAGRL